MWIDSTRRANDVLELAPETFRLFLDPPFAEDVGERCAAPSSSLSTDTRFLLSVATRSTFELSGSSESLESSLLPCAAM